MFGQGDGEGEVRSAEGARSAETRPDAGTASWTPVGESVGGGGCAVPSRPFFVPVGDSRPDHSNEEVLRFALHRRFAPTNIEQADAVKSRRSVIARARISASSNVQFVPLSRRSSMRSSLSDVWFVLAAFSCRCGASAGADRSGPFDGHGNRRAGRRAARRHRDGEIAGAAWASARPSPKPTASTRSPRCHRARTS